MEITTKGRYAVRIMVEIAKHNGEYVSVQKIADSQEISVKYLEKIVNILVKESLLDSLRGKEGGYRLTKSPKDYTIGEILNATGDQTEIVSCLHGTTCKRACNCETQGLWSNLDALINDYLKNVTLDDLLKKKIKKPILKLKKTKITRQS